VRENEKYEEAMHQRELARRMKTLKRVDLFAQMSEDELHQLAARLKYAPFAKGNMIVKQGVSKQHWLFIIINGEAEVYLEKSNGEKLRLNVLS
jgi:signal-transduction protein with cAMP-binding, CBS, and nucleotidyltransferase domain